MPYGTLARSARPSAATLIDAHTHQDDLIGRCTAGKLVACEKGFWNNETGSFGQDAVRRLGLTPALGRRPERPMLRFLAWQCRECPAGSTTRKAGSSYLSSCICMVDTFDNASYWYGSVARTNMSAPECRACPVGSTCTEEGATVLTLPLDKGYCEPALPLTLVVPQLFLTPLTCSDPSPGRAADGVGQCVRLP